MPVMRNMHLISVKLWAYLISLYGHYVNPMFKKRDVCTYHSNSGAGNERYTLQSLWFLAAMQTP